MGSSLQAPFAATACIQGPSLSRLHSASGVRESQRHTHRALLWGKGESQAPPPAPQHAALNLLMGCLQPGVRFLQTREAMGFRQNAEGLCILEDTPSLPFKMDAMSVKKDL